MEDDRELTVTWTASASHSLQSKSRGVQSKPNAIQHSKADTALEVSILEVGGDQLGSFSI
jgi:hypothetical protein